MAGKSGKIPFIEIYALNRKPSSGCEFFVVEERQGLYIAKCNLREQYIISPSVSRCEILWEQCPYRRLYLQTMGEEAKREKS